MKRARLAPLALIALLLGGGAWFYFNFERVPGRERVGFQGEARRNPFLAAMRLIERMGVRTREARRVTDLDVLPPGGTLILARHRAGLTKPRVERILSWVAAGGHLILEAEGYRDPDALLDALGVMRRELRLRPPARPSDITLPHATAPLRVYFGYRMDLIDLKRQAAVAVDDHWSVLLLHFARGRGSVTVLNGLGFMSNDHIGEHDHAEFVWQLVRFNPSTHEVLVAPKLRTPSPVAWLADQAWPVAVIAGLLLALWLWRIVPRFGPLQPDPPPARRQLLDHLRASGLFHWNSGGAARLLAAAREVCMSRVGRNHPEIASLPALERAARLAALSGLPGQDIAFALEGVPAQPAQFTAVIRTLQAVGEKLTRRIAG